MIKTYLKKSKYDYYVVGLPFKDLKQIKEFIDSKNWAQNQIANVFWFSNWDLKIYFKNGAILKVNTKNKY